MRAQKAADLAGAGATVSDETIRLELARLQREFEEFRERITENGTHTAVVMKSYRSEVVRIGDDTAKLLIALRVETTTALMKLQRDVEALLELIAEKGHA